MPSREPHTHGKTFSSFLLPFRFHTVPENPGGLAPGSNDFSDWCLQTVSLSHLSLAAALPACLPLSLHVTPLLCSLSPVRLSPGAGGLGVHLCSRPALSVLHALPVGPDFLPAPGSGSAALGGMSKCGSRPLPGTPVPPQGPQPCSAVSEIRC